MNLEQARQFLDAAYEQTQAAQAAPAPAPVVTWKQAAAERAAAEAECAAIQAALSEALWRLELARSREYRAELEWTGDPAQRP